MYEEEKNIVGKVIVIVVCAFAVRIILTFMRSFFPTFCLFFTTNSTFSFHDCNYRLLYFLPLRCFFKPYELIALYSLSV